MRVLIIGMHRSGTSALVRVLESIGFYAGTEADFNTPTPHDSLDYREHHLVWSANETALTWVGKSWRDPVNIEWDLLTDARRADLLGAINYVIDTLDVHGNWVAKDPRLCLTLPLWRMVSEPTCIMTHRNPLEVALSLRSRDNIPIFGGIALWEAYQRAALRNSLGLQRIFVGFTELADHHTVFAERLAARLTAAMPGLAVRTTASGPSTFDAALIRQRRPRADVAGYLNPAQQRLLDALNSAVAGEPGSDDAIDASGTEPLSEQSVEVIGILAAHRRRLAELQQRDNEISQWNESLLADSQPRRTQH